MDHGTSEAPATTHGHYIPSATPRAMATSTQLALLATDPATLTTSARFGRSDLAGKRAIGRIVYYIELLRDNLYLRRRYLAAGGWPQHYTGSEPPAFPFDEPAWDEWLLRPARASLDAFDIALMPLPPPWGPHPPFASALDLFEHIDATWAADADQWRKRTRRALDDAGLGSANDAARPTAPDPAHPPAGPMLHRTDGLIRADDAVQLPQWHQAERWLHTLLPVNE